MSYFIVTGASPFGTVPPGGDLSGSYPSPTDIKINGAAVPAAGSLTTGNVLQVNGASALTYSAVNLAGGSNFVTGTLPTGNQALQSMVGDVTGTTGASTVVKIQGNTVTSGALTKGQFFVASSTSNWAATTLSGDVSESSSTSGLLTVISINSATVPAVGTGLTTGNVLQVNGTSALTYSAVNLAGGSNYVTGSLPVSNIAPGTSAQVLMSNATPATTWTTLSSDVTISATGTTTVNSISGASPISITPATLQWATATNSPTLKQADNTTNSATAQALTIQAANATGTSATGGALALKAGTGTTAGGAITFNTASTTSLTEAGRITAAGAWQIGSGAASISTVGLINFGQTTASTTNMLSVKNSQGTSSTFASMWHVNSSDDRLQIGPSAGVAGVGNMLIWIGNTTNVQVGTSCIISNTSGSDGITLTPATTTTCVINFSTGSTAAKLSQGNNSTAGATAATMTVQAQNATGTGTTTGGGLTLTSGTGTSLNGATRLQLGGTTIAELSNLVSGQRIISLNLAANLTTTQMPANTGDLVLYVANAATVPTANSVSGGILYASGGALLWRGSSGTVTTIAPA